MGLIGALITGAVSIISTVVSTIGPTIASATSALITKLPMEVLKAKTIMDGISFIISKVAEFFGLVPKDEKIEELGAKAMQEDTRPQMEGETTQEYLDYLRKDVQLDEEKYTQMSDTEKLACSALGTTIVSKSIQEKFGVELSPDFLVTMYKTKMKYEQVTKFIENFSNNGFTSMNQLTKYITNDLSEVQAQKIGGVIKTSLKELNPDLSNSDIQKQIVDMKREYNSAEL